MTERDLTKQVLKRLRQLPNSFWYKVHGGPMQRSGIPDVIGCWGGDFMAFELKMPGKNLTNLQQMTKQSIDAALGFCHTIHSLAELEAVLEAHQ